MNGTAGTVEPLERRIGAWVHALMLSVRQRPDGVILLPLFARINQLLSACERERERDKDADTLARDRHRAFAFLAVVERSPLLDEEERAIVREAMSDWCQALPGKLGPTSCSTTATHWPSGWNARRRFLTRPSSRPEKSRRVRGCSRTPGNTRTQAAPEYERPCRHVHGRVDRPLRALHRGGT